MKVFMVGALDKLTMKELAGAPVVILTGTLDEVRSSARFMFNGEVTIGPKDAPSPCASNLPEAP